MGANESNALKRDEIEELMQRTHYERKELRQLYKQFREEAPSGLIQKKDFKNLAKAMGITDPFLTDLVFNAFDKNKDGSIEFAEFICAMSVLTRGTADEKLEFAFSLYDLDGDGYITREEMTKIVRSLYVLIGDLVQQETQETFDSPEELVEKIFNEMDENSDGRLTLEEYKAGALRDPAIVQGLGLFDVI